MPEGLGDVGGPKAWNDLQGLRDRPRLLDDVHPHARVVLGEGPEDHLLIGQLFDPRLNALLPPAVGDQQPDRFEAALSPGQLVAIILRGPDDYRLEEAALLDVVGQLRQLLRVDGLARLPGVGVDQLRGRSAAVSALRLIWWPCLTPPLYTVWLCTGPPSGRPV